MKAGAANYERELRLQLIPSRFGFQDMTAVSSDQFGTVVPLQSLIGIDTRALSMSVLHRPAAAVAIVLTILATSPASAQQEQQQRRIQQQRPLQQRRSPIGQNHPQEAQHRHGGNGAGVAAGVIGGLAAGALLGGVLSGRGGPAEPGYDGEVEGGPGPGYGGGCPPVRQPVYDGAGVFVGYQAVPSC